MHLNFPGTSKLAKSPVPLVCPVLGGSCPGPGSEGHNRVSTAGSTGAVGRWEAQHPEGWEPAALGWVLLQRGCCAALSGEREGPSGEALGHSSGSSFCGRIKKCFRNVRQWLVATYGVRGDAFSKVLMAWLRLPR